MIDQFAPIDGELHCEQVALGRIASEVGTPVYVYSAAMFRAQARAFRAALAGVGRSHLAYAVKANPNLAVLKLMAAEGYGDYLDQVEDLA